MKRWMLYTLALGVCLTHPAALVGQGASGKDSYADEDHRNRCRLAHQVLTLGQPADRRDWALETAPTCGASGGETLVALLDEHRGDAQETPALEAVVMLTSRMTDATLFRAALRMGVDPSAGPAARVAAWRVALYQLVPGSYARPEVPTEDGEVAESGATSTAAPMAGAPLPADRLSMTRQALEGALAGGGAPQALNDMMRRVLEAVALEERIERVCGPGVSLWDSACEEALNQNQPDG